jgi:hypothetical protein
MDGVVCPGIGTSVAVFAAFAVLIARAGGALAAGDPAEEGVDTDRDTAGDAMLNERIQL